MPRFGLPALALLWLAGACCAAGCAAGRTKVQLPFDVAVVPGCPAEPDGSLSACLSRRATWAALLWERGSATHFITSGAAVHSPYVEAEALAAAMAALGVPPERIYLDPDALHTDENMYNSMLIARALGLRRVAVASEGMQASGGCQMMHDWGQQCAALSMEYRAVARRQEEKAAVLSRLRTPPVRQAQWLTLDERERRAAVRTGRSRRPPSFLLYPWMGLRRLFGRPWVPFAPAQVPKLTWLERSRTWSSDR